MTRIEDLSRENLEDVFKVCSYNRLDDHVQRRGMSLKRAWLLMMLDEYGPCTKIAYQEDRPVAQALFFPEESVPFIPQPREDVVLLNCVYNPFLEVQGRGVATALVNELIDECRTGLPCLGGDPCSFIAAKPFETGEGISLRDFYARLGFVDGSFESYLEITGDYMPRESGRYVPLKEDEGRVVVFYDVMCEWGYGMALRVRDAIYDVDPEISVELIDPWERPEEYVRRGNQWLVVNAKPIKSFVTDRDNFEAEILGALQG
ncbi:MAG TPA: hypothetical protein VM050_11975 [Patescibacteria group bacterium]|nr:hypothetical protein [Patescibacteria group bacterium]